MKTSLSIIVILFAAVALLTAQQTQQWTIAIHGGAGNFTAEDIPDSLQAEYKKVMDEALREGSRILDAGGMSLDAVEATIKILENSPLFNAGKGAVFTAEGKNELDASIMDGSNHNAGAIAGVTNIKNPISAARRVMHDSKHVFLAREGAEEFAKEAGVDIVDPTYFYTERRWNALLQAKNKKMSTVGCVALDMYGNLAAGTSTGGMTNKAYGRIGDSPVIGAGTYADNSTCAVSATGHGEFFIRYVVAYDISARMRYQNEPLDKAASEVIQGILKPLDANGGVIAIDYQGNVVAEFNTSGMFRGWIKSNGENSIEMFK